MRSMTGYGRSARDLEGGAGSPVRVVVEIRSVNHRGFDLKIRSDDPDPYCDAEITRIVRAAVERGTIAVSIRFDGASGIGLDGDRIREAHAELERIRREVGLPAPVDLATVGAFLAGLPGGRSSPPRGEEMWKLLSLGVQAAVTELGATREEEGRALRLDLTERLECLAEIVQEIAGAVASLPARFARRLEERLATLRGTPGVDPGRIAQEIALMAERLDVTEELVRLRTHLDHLRRLLDATVPVGRKLDFVIQEIGREINTVGSKAQDAAVAAQVIDAKAELEKIREQAQNVE